MSLKIGIDLDNTIVVYNDLILDICYEKGIKIPQNLFTKEAISDFLKATGRNKEWTDIQALIYGPEMYRAKLAPGFSEFSTLVIKTNSKLALISNRSYYAAHDTEEKYNLHTCAKNWIDKNLPSTFESINFESCKGNKIRLASASNFDYFIDDLDEMVSGINVKIECIKINNQASMSQIKNKESQNVGLNWFGIAEKIFGS